MWQFLYPCITTSVGIDIEIVGRAMQEQRTYKNLLVATAVENNVLSVSSYSMRQLLVVFI